MNTIKKAMSSLATVTVAALLAASCGSDAKPAAAPTTTAAPTTSAVPTTAAAPTTSATPATTAETVPPTAAPTTSSAADTTVPATTGPAPTEPSTTAPVLTAPFPIDTLMQTFVDTSRPTVPAGGGAQLPSRTLITTIVYPVAPGPFPLIELSHGITGSPSRLMKIASAWARAGYVVAMPQFPLTSNPSGDPALDDAPNANLADVNNQPKDVSFVLDNLLRLNGDDTSPIFGRIDPDRIGVAGHSLGAATTYGVAFNSCCADPRIKAVVIMAGFIFINPGNDFTRPLPILILHGDADTTLNIALDQSTYPQLAGPKWFITLLGAEHSPPFEDTVSPYDSLVETATTDFWNGYLGKDAAAITALRTDAAVTGLSTMQTSE